MGNYDIRARREYYIGLNYDKKPPKYIMGRWSFNNSISATIYEHINAMGDGAYAKSVIIEFEKLLSHPALAQVSDPNLFDLAEKIPHPTAQCIGKIGNQILKCSSILGGIVDDANVNSKSIYNRYTAKDPKRYVAYAMKYWAKNPSLGPSYIYTRNSV